MGRLASALLVTAALAGCVAPDGPTRRPTRPTAPVQRPPVAMPRPHPVAGLEGVMGQSARSLVALFGTPGLDLREGAARKLQFLGPACVLDAYLYPSRRGGEPVVTHVDTRLPDGRDTDRADCVAALSRR
jgi:hypothetical protein